MQFIVEFFKKQKFTKKQLTISTIIFVIFLIFVIRLSIRSAYKLPTTEDLSRVKGEVNAPLKILEYSDLQCEFCAEGAKIIRDFMAKNPEAIRLEVRYYPMPSHKFAVLAARYAECSARQDKFWNFHALATRRQYYWSKEKDPTESFEKMTREIQLDDQQLKECLSNSDELDELITESYEQGHGLGVRSTPTYFINGEMVVGLHALEDTLTAYRASKLKDKTEVKK